ncbi:hypothetical protein BC938DRAFT_477557 [Jimgerdemannia flammicorona]|uniref:Alpha/Beta hydrolase protein n=1 Tax=Jimgerdemannia flammicorona TaxID=994334 RepID=A0A433QP73_9FUNG|nr:hypothetical protein BC938DRAFT_477557 [Jimgerdemannia flammicorona]
MQPETEWMRSSSSSRVRIAGIVGIGTGYNFTERWLTGEVPKLHREDNEYVYQRPSQYSETGYYEVPVSMLLNSREFLLPETGRIEMGCPVTFVHGTMDTDSKYETLVSLAERIDGKVEVVTVEGGDHRLSSEEELCVIERVVKKMVNDVSRINQTN